MSVFAKCIMVLIKDSRWRMSYKNYVGRGFIAKSLLSLVKNALEEHKTTVCFKAFSTMDTVDVTKKREHRPSSWSFVGPSSAILTLLSIPWCTSSVRMFFIWRKYFCTYNSKNMYVCINMSIPSGHKKIVPFESPVMTSPSFENVKHVIYLGLTLCCWNFT